MKCNCCLEINFKLVFHFLSSTKEINCLFVCLHFSSTISVSLYSIQRIFFVLFLFFFFMIITHRHILTNEKSASQIESIRTRTYSVSNSHIYKRNITKKKQIHFRRLANEFNRVWIIEIKSFEHVERVLCRMNMNGGGRRCRFSIICGRQTSTHICLFARHIICPVVAFVVSIDTNVITFDSNQLNKISNTSFFFFVLLTK